MQWNYHDRGGAIGWARLTLPGTSDLAFPDCRGSRQSPIDIPAAAPLSKGVLSLDYRRTKLRVTNTGLALQVDCDAGSTLSLAGQSYGLQQFHFHAPGEHRVDGSFGALEVHFVHQGDDGGLAVVGALIDAGAANPVFEQVLETMPLSPGTEVSDTSIDPRRLLPANLACYVYDGSLTTPPCTEGVRWHVVRQRMTASEAQIERFRALPFLNPGGRFVGNARPVQPLNGRPGIA